MESIKRGKIPRDDNTVTEIIDECKEIALTSKKPLFP